MLCGDSSGCRWKPLAGSAVSLPDDRWSGARESRRAGKDRGPAPVTGSSRQMPAAVSHRP
nr:hypothetical protein GCM10020093_094010 [Planobispora longispora]